MTQITELFNIHFAEADYKVLFGNLLIVIGVCTILFFAFIETEPEVEMPVVETMKTDPPKRAAPASAAKKGNPYILLFVAAICPHFKGLVILSLCPTFCNCICISTAIFFFKIVMHHCTALPTQLLRLVHRKRHPVPPLPPSPALTHLSSLLISKPPPPRNPQQRRLGRRLRTWALHPPLMVADPPDFVHALRETLIKSLPLFVIVVL